MLDFLANYWPWLIAVTVVVLAVFAFRGLRKALKEGGGAFNLETIKRNTDPNFAALKQKSKALLADADMICETKEGSNLVKTFLRYHPEFALVEEKQHFPFDSLRSAFYYAVLVKQGETVAIDPPISELSQVATQGAAAFQAAGK